MSTEAYFIFELKGNNLKHGYKMPSFTQMYKVSSPLIRKIFKSEGDTVKKLTSKNGKVYLTVKSDKTLKDLRQILMMFDKKCSVYKKIHACVSASKVNVSRTVGRRSRSKSSSQKPCKPGQYRHPETNRCRNKSPVRKPRSKSPSLKSRSPRCVKDPKLDNPLLKRGAARKGPPYHANDCPGKRKRGNDGNMWESKFAGKTYRWIRVK